MSIFKKMLDAIEKFFKPSSKTKSRGRKSNQAFRIKRSKQSALTKRKPVLKSLSKSKSPKKFKKSKSQSLSSSKTASQSLRPSQKKSTLTKEKSIAASPIGEITHYFDRIKVCVIRIDRDHIIKGDRVEITGPRGSLVQKVNSMQIENEEVGRAQKGQLIGLKVTKPVFVGDRVFNLN